ncbi:Ulp1 peptidase [Gracilaria domingensis]|nr:Ulp1 peptidase [Gracilaria domingensis]
MTKRRCLDFDYFSFAMCDDGTGPNSLARSPFLLPKRSVRTAVPGQLSHSERQSNADQTPPRRPPRARQRPGGSQSGGTADQRAVRTTHSNSYVPSSSQPTETRRDSSATPKKSSSKARRRTSYVGPMSLRMGGSRMTTKFTGGERIKMAQLLQGENNPARQQHMRTHERMKLEREQLRQLRKAEKQQRRAKSIMASRRCENYNDVVIDLTQTDDEKEPKETAKEEKLEMVSDDDDDDGIMQALKERNYRSQKVKAPCSEPAALEEAYQTAPTALPTVEPSASKEKEKIILLSSDDEGSSRLKRRRATKQHATSLCGLSVLDSSFAPPGSDLDQDEPMPPRSNKSAAKRKRSPLKQEDPLKPVQDQIEADLQSIENCSRKIQSAKQDDALLEKKALDLMISTVPAFPKELSKNIDGVIVVSDEESSVQVIKDTPHKSGMKRVTENRTIPTKTFYGKSKQTEGGRVGKIHYPGLKPKIRDDPRPQEVIPLEPSDEEDDDVIECEPVTRQTGRLNLSDYEMPDYYVKQEPRFELDSKRARDIRFRALDMEELTLIRSLTHEVPKQRVLVRIQEANIQLKGEDFACLRGSRWLNDEILNSFVALINSRNIRDVRSEAKLENDGLDFGKAFSIDVDAPQDNLHDIFSRKRPRTHMFNTFFFPRLTQKGYDYRGVRRWLRRAGLSVLNLDLILIPINLKNFHWVLTAIDLRSKHFLYLDSTYGKDTSNTIPMLRKWLFDEVKDKHGAEAAEKMGISFWRVHVNPSYLPRQQDGGSCGIFTLYMADYLERGLCPNFTQEDIRNLRWRTVLFLNDGIVPT